MDKFEYKYLKGRKDRVGIKWEFENTVYEDKTLIDILNVVGDMGWQLVSKETDTELIMMRKKG